MNIHKIYDRICQTFLDTMKRNETSARIKEIMSSLLYYLSYWYSRTN